MDVARITWVHVSESVKDFFMESVRKWGTPPPVLKINNHATGGWRTKDILGGPKSLETKKTWQLKGLRGPKC